jgi:hypothetical protein
MFVRRAVSTKPPISISEQYTYRWGRNTSCDHLVMFKVQQDFVRTHEWGADDHIIAVEVRYVHVNSAVNSWSLYLDVCTMIYGCPTAYSA